MPQIGDTEIFEVAYYDSGNALIVPNPAPTITIISPTGTTLVNAATMTQLGTSAVFKYEYTYAANGSHKWYTTTADTDASPASTPMLSIVVTDPPDVNVVTIATNAIDADALAADAAAEIAAAVLDEALSGHVTSGTVGAALSAIQSRTNLIGTASASIDAPYNVTTDTLTILKGDAYTSDVNRPPIRLFSTLLSSVAGVTSYSFVIKWSTGGEYILTIEDDSADITFSSPTLTAIIQLVSSVTAGFPLGTHDGEFKAHFGSNEVTLNTFKVKVS